MKTLLLIVILTIGPALCLISSAMHSQDPDPAVYHVSKNADGELLVYCANGGDATIRPDARFGYITVSCGR